MRLEQQFGVLLDLSDKLYDRAAGLGFGGLL
jgi:hypothetical protein